MKILGIPAIGLTALLFSVPSWAAKPASTKPAAETAKPAAETAKPAAQTPPASAAKDAKEPAKEVASKDVATAEEFEDKYSLVEKPGKPYYFVGLRGRYGWIPKFMMTLFGNGGTTVAVPSVGPEFTIRKNGFEYVMSLQYSMYSMDATPFKSKTDPAQSWELVTANLKALYFMTDFLWSSEINPAVAINYGAGIGIAAVWGDLKRVQAYPGAGGEGDPYSYLPCTGPQNPHPFCGSDNTHYGNYTEPSWSNGGSRPILFPWLAVQTGVRYKPHRHFALRFDLGWNLLNGPFLGLAGNYGI